MGSLIVHASELHRPATSSGGRAQSASSGFMGGMMGMAPASASGDQGGMLKQRKQQH